MTVIKVFGINRLFVIYLFAFMVSNIESALSERQCITLVDNADRNTFFNIKNRKDKTGFKLVQKELFQDILTI